MMIPEDATSVAKYMYRIKSIVGGDYYFVMKVLPQCFCLFDSFWTVIFFESLLTYQFPYCLA